MNRRLQGITNYHEGEVAEEIVCQHYERLGAKALARRWRCACGEVDLVFGVAEGIVVVEVKKGDSFETAATKLLPAQLQRIARSAEQFIATQPDGQLTPVRIDLALVNRVGAIKILKNITL